MFWLAALSVGLSAAGAASQASAQRRSSAYSRDVALNNQKIAQDNARDVELRGRLSVYDQRRAVARQLGDIRVATAGAGLEVDVAGTTPQDMVQSMVEAGELDVLRLRNNIDREVRRALIQGAEFEAQAGQFELQRQSYNPFRSALTAGAGSALSNHDILFES
jgi:hypothetical protein